MFTRFIISDVFIETFEFPIARNIAAPALYIPINGIDADTMSKYVFA